MRKGGTRTGPEAHTGRVPPSTFPRRRGLRDIRTSIAAGIPLRKEQHHGARKHRFDHQNRD